MLIDELKNRVEILVNKYKYKRQTALAYVREGGRCGYCGVDLVSSKTAYSAGTIDHLLPQTKYPQFSEVEENYVLTCVACNSFKKAYDPLEAGEDPVEMLKEHRNELIRRVQVKFENQWDENENIRREVEKIVCRRDLLMK